MLSCRRCCYTALFAPCDLLTIVQSCCCCAALLLSYCLVAVALPHCHQGDPWWSCCLDCHEFLELPCCLAIVPSCFCHLLLHCHLVLLPLPAAVMQALLLTCFSCGCHTSIGVVVPWHCCHTLPPNCFCCAVVMPVVLLCFCCCAALTVLGFLVEA